MAIFRLQWQSWIVAVETIWPTKPKIFSLATYRRRLSTSGLENDFCPNFYEMPFLWNISIVVNFSSVKKVHLCGSLFSQRLITHVVLNWKCNTQWKWTQSQNNGNSLDGSLSLSRFCLSLSFSCCLFLSSLLQIWAKHHLKNLYTLGFPDGSRGKEPTCQCRRCKRQKFNPWIRMILWRRAWQPTLVFLPEEPPWTEKPGRLQSKGS